MASDAVSGRPPVVVQAMPPADAVWRDDWHRVYPCPACQPDVLDDEAWALTEGMRFCPNCGVPLQWRDAALLPPVETSLTRARVAAWRPLITLTDDEVLLGVKVLAPGADELVVILGRGSAGHEVVLFELWLQDGTTYLFPVVPRGGAPFWVKHDPANVVVQPLVQHREGLR